MNYKLYVWNRFIFKSLKYVNFNQNTSINKPKSTRGLIDYFFIIKPISRAKSLSTGQNLSLLYFSILLPT